MWAKILTNFLSRRKLGLVQFFDETLIKLRKLLVKIMHKTYAIKMVNNMLLKNTVQSFYGITVAIKNLQKSVNKFTEIASKNYL